MQPVYSIFILLWIAFFAYWWIPAILRGRRQAKRVSSHGSFFGCMILPIAAFAIILSLIAPGIAETQVIDNTLPVILAGLAILIGGLAFAIWARVHLGSNWSARPAIQQDHTLTRTGPYAYVRHPIYTGLLAGVLGTVIAYGTVLGFIAILVMLIALCLKIRIEEKFLAEEFGGEYERYRHEVKALIPFVL